MPGSSSTRSPTMTTAIRRAASEPSTIRPSQRLSARIDGIPGGIGRAPVVVLLHIRAAGAGQALRQAGVVQDGYHRRRKGLGRVGDQDVFTRAVDEPLGADGG